MVVLIILLALILLIFFVPYGVDASYIGGVFGLKIKAGPLRIRLLPKKPLTEKQQERARRKKEKKEARKAEKERKKREKEESAAAGGVVEETIKVREKKKPDIDFILALLKMGAHAIRRFFRSFSIDFFLLHYTAASGDPYTTAMQYGYICSAAEALPALCGDVIHVRRKDIRIASDFTTSKAAADVRIVISLQLFLIVHMAFAFGYEFIKWKIQNRGKAPADASERKGHYGRQQDQ